MYAVVKTGGKQYRVAKNDVLTVEKLEGDAGTTIELDNVLAMDDGKGLTVGAPSLPGAHVTAEVLEQKKGDKVVIFKKKRRKNYRRTRGHRQQLTVIRVTDILSSARKASAQKNEDSVTKDTKAASAKKVASKTKGKANAKGKVKAKGKAKAVSKSVAKKAARKVAKGK